MKPPKLVRDKIPEIILKNNRTPITHIATKTKYWEKLNKKLKEEVNEFIENPIEEELADILEVIYAISDYKKFSREKVNLIRQAKLVKRGGFTKKIILDKIK